MMLYRKSGCDYFLCNCGTRFHFTRATWPTVAELEAEMGIGAPVSTSAGMDTGSAVAAVSAALRSQWVVPAGVGLLAGIIHAGWGWATVWLYGVDDGAS